MQLIEPTKPLLAGLLLLAATQAHATLTSYTAKDGVEVVYSSVSDVTWTKDANLLGSMIAAQGFNSLVNAIVAASPTITVTPNTFNPSGSYTLSSADFRSNGNGSVTWFGAMAFINYLNSINYAGSGQWRLPTVATLTSGYNTSTNGTIAGDELVELLYSELGSKGAFDINGNPTLGGYGIIDPDKKFENIRLDNFWTSTEANSLGYDMAWVLDADDAMQGQLIKDNRNFVWAITDGQISTVSAVPVPATIWLFGSGLLGLAGFARRKKR